MPVETCHRTLTSPFTSVIQDHLELKKQNAELDGKCRSTATDRGSVREPSAVQVRGAGSPRGDDGRRAGRRAALAAPCRGRVRTPSSMSSPEGPALDEGLWGRSRDFDWGE